MPGFLESTLHQGYDFLSPYVEKAQPYVEKARNHVPLVDPALKKAEKFVPALITRADQLAEPHVERMRPYVEPRIEKVKERVTPYMDEGVKRCGALRVEGMKYYNVGLGKVDYVMSLGTKETQMRTSHQDGTRTGKLGKSTMEFLLLCVLQVAMFFQSLLLQVIVKLAPTVLALTQTSLFKKVIEVAVLCCEKIIGKKQTVAILGKVEAYIPTLWKATTPPASGNPVAKAMVSKEK